MSDVLSALNGIIQYNSLIFARNTGRPCREGSSTFATDRQPDTYESLIPALVELETYLKFATATKSYKSQVLENFQVLCPLYMKFVIESSRCRPKLQKYGIFYNKIVIQGFRDIDKYCNYL